MATIKDVKVRVRVNILMSEVDPDTGKEVGQGKIIKELPEFIIDEGELGTRIDHGILVMRDGYWVDPDDIPPKVITDVPTLITATTALLHGHVKSCSAGIAAACGFKIGTTKAPGTTHVATQSPVANVAMLPISYPLTNLVANTKYYYRAYATDAHFSGGKYGRLKSFTTLAV
jgi:hypothetical protein